MFLKYVTGTTELGVRVFGMVHGVVFIAYCLSTLLVGIDQRWTRGRVLLGLASSVPPFMTVWFDRYAERRGALGASWRLRWPRPRTAWSSVRSPGCSATRCAVPWPASSRWPPSPGWPCWSARPGADRDPTSTGQRSAARNAFQVGAFAIPSTSIPTLSCQVRSADWVAVSNTPPTASWAVPLAALRVRWRRRTSGPAEPAFSTGRAPSTSSDIQLRRDQVVLAVSPWPVCHLLAAAIVAAS